MEAVDLILIVVNVGITVISMYGAHKSLKYYKKSKILSEHTNVNKALVEIEKMLNKLPEALTAVNKSRQNKRGFNFLKTICDIGNDLHISYNEIRACTPPEYSADLFALEDENRFDLHKYINEYISGEVLRDNELNSDDLLICQKRLMAMQDFLKHRMEEIAEKLK